MKFGYSYKTSDGARYEAELVAKCKEEAFQALRSRRIRPIKVWEITPWYKVSKRTITIVILLLMLITSLSALLVVRDNEENVPQVRIAIRDSALARPKPRRYYSGFDDVDKTQLTEADRFLSAFVCPTRAVPEEVAQKVGDEQFLKMLEASISVMPRIGESDSEAMVELKSIIAGLKQEARMIRSNGRNIAEVLQYFIDRQGMEKGHRDRVLSQCRAGQITEEDCSAMFDSMGFPPKGY